MDPIAKTFGSNRIIQGSAITNPLAQIDPDPAKEYEARRQIVKKAVDYLTSSL